MKLALASFLPVLLAASAFGSPTISTPRETSLELESRQTGCDIAKCLQTIANQTAGIITPCGAALTNLVDIGEAIAQGKQPSQADVSGLISNTLKCVTQSVAAGFAIPGVCLSCVI